MRRFFLCLFILTMFSACAASPESPTDYNYPKSAKDNRRDQYGTIGEDGGILDYFGDKSKNLKELKLE